MARKASLLLPGNKTIRVLYAIVLLFGINAILAVLRLAAEHRTAPTAPSYDPHVLGHLATALGCEDIGSGSEEVGVEDIRCKLKLLHAALAVDGSGLLNGSNFQSEYKTAVRGTPLQPLHHFRSPCWVSAIAPNSTVSRHKRASVTRQQHVEGVLRCMPGLVVLGTDPLAMRDIMECLKLHPDIVPPTSFNRSQPWFSRKVKFSEYVDSFHEQSGQLQEIFLAQHRARRTDEGQTTTPGVIVQIGPAALHHHPDWSLGPRNYNMTEPAHLLPHTLSLLNPHLTVVMVLRHPTDRVISGYQKMYGHDSYRATANGFHDHLRDVIHSLHHCLRHHTKRACVYSKEFQNSTGNDHLAELLRGSIYPVFLKDWLQVFPSSQLLIKTTEEYFSDRKEVLDNIYIKLKLKSLPAELQTRVTHKNVPLGREEKTSFIVLDKTRRLLTNFFEHLADDNSEAQQTSQQDKLMYNDTLF